MSVSGDSLASYESEIRRAAGRVGIVTPAPPGSRRGNRVTAERWAALLGECGYAVRVVEEYADEPFRAEHLADDQAAAAARFDRHSFDGEAPPERLGVTHRTAHERRARCIRVRGRGT